MTARDMSYVDTLTYVNQLFTGERMNSSDNMFLVVISSAANVVNVLYKNQGWYAAGSVFEVWVTSGAPSISPPSGHVLTDYSYVVLQP